MFEPTFFYSKLTRLTWPGKSSMGKWGHQGIFRPVFFFFSFFFKKRCRTHKTKKSAKSTKSTKREQMISISLKIFACAKNRCLCCFSFAYFCFVSLFLLVTVFVRVKFSCKKNRSKIVLITLFTLHSFLLVWRLAWERAA